MVGKHGTDETYGLKRTFGAGRNDQDRRRPIVLSHYLRLIMMKRIKITTASLTFAATWTMLASALFGQTGPLVQQGSYQRQAAADPIEPIPLQAPGASAYPNASGYPMAPVVTADTVPPTPHVASSTSFGLGETTAPNLPKQTTPPIGAGIAQGLGSPVGSGASAPLATNTPVPYGTDQTYYGATSNAGGRTYSANRHNTRGDRGIFFVYDAFYATLSDPGLATVGSDAAAGIFTVNGIDFPFTNSFSSDFIDSSPEFGHRIEFGGYNGHLGWIASFLMIDQDKAIRTTGGWIQFDDPIGMLLGYQDSTGDGVDDDINGNNIYGRFGLDLGTPDPLNPGTYLLDPMGNPIYDGIPDTTQIGDLDGDGNPDTFDAGDLLTWVPIFAEMSARNRVNLDGFSFSFAQCRSRCGGRFGGVTMLLGVRLIDFDEDFSLAANGSPNFETLNIDSSISNFVIGPEIGATTCGRWGPWRLNGAVRVLFGANILRGVQTAAFTVNENADGFNQPVNLFPLSSSNVEKETEFAPVFEWRTGVSYDITPSIAAQVGYTGMYLDGVSRAATSTDYVLPTFGLNLGNDHLLINALTFGLEFYH